MTNAGDSGGVHGKLACANGNQCPWQLNKMPGLGKGLIKVIQDSPLINSVRHDLVTSYDSEIINPPIRDPLIILRSEDGEGMAIYSIRNIQPVAVRPTLSADFLEALRGVMEILQSEGAEWNTQK